jgi:hypothetical protein
MHFTGECPSFCAYCGQPLGSANLSLTADYVGREAATLPPSASPPPGAAPPEMVGNYRLIRQLGSGGMGRVYEAEDTASGRRVAVKLLASEFASDDALQRFRQEGRLASAIAHPRCVFVLAADEEAGRPYIVMELMHGSTLKDLVDKEGPLPPADAVAKALDAIEGLQEAHRLGVIHRDVKPSNCFLEPDGRVKVGDFGLAKSLAAGSHLTRTGAFLGTPLFASPEQIRKDPLDAQTDVYSVAATLYFLLTGRAPFESNDAAATMARIVSDPAPPVQSLRPEVPAALDRVLLRGLERLRERRWRDLEEFRQALLPFVPGRASPAGLRLRLGAYLIDLAPFVLLSILVNADLVPLEGGHPGSWSAAGAVAFLSPAVGAFLYFALMDGVWGCTLGKRLLRLRVCPLTATHAPGLKPAVRRAAVFFGLVAVIPEAVDLATGPEAAGLWFSRGDALFVASHALVLLPMRRRNGFRGTHELLSGTRVVQLPWPEKRLAMRRRPLDRTVLRLTRPAGLPEHLGPFIVQGDLRWTDDSKVLLGQDAALGRQVWIWLRPEGAAPGSVRQHVNRMTRLRWLAGGRHDDLRWDALLAPAGCSLPDLIASEGRLAWPHARQLLQQLADELAQACQEMTLPPRLTVDQVWVQPSGQVQLLDMAVTGSVTGPVEAPADGDQERALALLGQAAALILEGRRRVASALTHPLCAPVPEHAAALLNRLLREGDPETSVEQVRAELAATRDRATEITPAWRGAHLILLTTLLFLPVLFMLAVPVATSNIHKVTKRVFLATLIRESEHQLGQLRVPAERDQLERKVDRARRFQEAFVHAGGPLFRWVYTANEEDPVQINVTTPPEEVKQALDAARQYPNLFEPDPVELLALEARWAWLVFSLLAFFPVLWVAWAFLLRGGFTLRMLDIMLLRSSGRRALRVQCAWRALLVWAPMVASLWASAWLDFWYWSHWRPGNPNAWAFWLSWACYGVALALLPAYAGLALRFPNRSLHDRLAGTYLVPR